MNLTDKIKNSWWVILSLVIVLNGVGFIYIGSKHNNRNWIIEGIIYEVPWFFNFTLFGVYGLSYPTSTLISLGLILMMISIIRSVWVAVKLGYVYDNYEKYTIKQTNLNTSAKNNNANNTTNNTNNSNKKDDNMSSICCCICIIAIFIIFAMSAL